MADPNPEVVFTRVLVVGAGPVGLTLAMDLASRGIDVLVVEQRAAGEAPSVKCNHVSARSMETFRRLGLAPKLRSAGLPEDFPNDCVYRTTTTGIELARIEIPCRRDRYTATGGPDTWWPTPEPPHRINQIHLEPLLFAHAAAQQRIQIYNQTQVESFEQDHTGVAAIVRDLASDTQFLIHCEFMIGCDGGKSLVRKGMGAQLAGTAVIQSVQSSYIHAPQLLQLMPKPPGWMNMSLNPRRCGTVVAIDGIDNWLIHNHLAPGEEDFESVDRDTAIRDILGVDKSFEYQLLANEDWVGRRLVADKFRDRRVFIAGDAAHLWMPYAGYGMNAGIADAVNLAFVLGGYLSGWGDEGLLEAYQAERQPITEQVSKFTMSFALAVMQQRGAVPALIEAPGVEGEAVRAQVGKAAYDLNVQQYCCGGLNFGYFYDTSPVILYDGEAHPLYSMHEFTASTVPGCRAPHVWLAPGRSLYDELSPAFTLLRTDPKIELHVLQAAAQKRGLPLKVIDLTPEQAGTEYSHRLTLVRSDQHVVWRANSIPADPRPLLDVLRGAAG